jgi:hypothetical protein
VDLADGFRRIRFVMRRLTAGAACCLTGFYSARDVDLAHEHFVACSVDERSSLVTQVQKNFQTVGGGPSNGGVNLTTPCGVAGYTQGVMVRRESRRVLVYGNTSI